MSGVRAWNQSGTPPRSSLSELRVIISSILGCTYVDGQLRRRDDPVAGGCRSGRSSSRREPGIAKLAERPGK